MIDLQLFDVLCSLDIGSPYAEIGRLAGLEVYLNSACQPNHNIAYEFPRPSLGFGSDLKSLIIFENINASGRASTKSNSATKPKIATLRDLYSP